MTPHVPFPPPRRVVLVPGLCLSCTTFLPFSMAEGERLYTGRMKFCVFCRRYRVVPVTEGDA
jgi:hypothetical protein